MCNFPVTDSYAKGIARLLISKLEKCPAAKRAKFIEKLSSQIGYNTQTIVFSLNQKDVAWISSHFIACPSLAHATLSALSYLRANQK